jgi:hypothetical protein
MLSEWLSGVFVLMCVSIELCSVHVVHTAVFHLAGTTAVLMSLFPVLPCKASEHHNSNCGDVML